MNIAMFASYYYIEVLIKWYNFLVVLINVHF